jgi:hypothetical protein
VPADIFVDSDGDILKYQAFLRYADSTTNYTIELDIFGGIWLGFDSSVRKLYGNPV